MDEDYHWGIPLACGRIGIEQKGNITGGAVGEVALLGDEGAGREE